MKKIVLMMLISSASMFALAAGPNDHPNYLKAMSDMRAARWLLSNHPGNYQSVKDEDFAVTKIDEALNEIKKASIDDGKDINDHPKMDEINQHVGRIQKAMEWLDKAHADIEKEEDIKFGNGLRDRAAKDIAEAREAAKKALLTAK
jgi:tetratricopeptide (TPR) repeat protein